MKTNTLSPFSFLGAILLTITFIGCSKPEDGAVGPAGPAGTANVIYSNWASAPTATLTNIDNASGYTTSITAPQLNQDILDKGTVLVYGKFSSTVFPLPYTSNAGGSTNTLTYYPEVNNIRLFRFKHDGSGGVNIPTSLSFRYIFIPGGTATGKLSPVDYTQMSYSEVCHYLKIAE